MSRRTALLLAGIAVPTLAGCGSAGQAGVPANHNAVVTAPGHAMPRAAAVPPSLRVVDGRSLPSARSGAAVAAYGTGLAVIGGLDGASVSTDTVLTLDAAGHTTTLAPLPSPVHDAAAAVLGGTLLLFGGGRSEGSDRVLQVAPGPPRQVATLPQALSDLGAAAIGSTVYVAGGWNGTRTNRDIYAYRPGLPVQTVGRLPLGVRYPALAGVGGRLIVAGGETDDGSPTRRGWSFDPSTRVTTALAELPVATDHAASVAFAGYLYVIGGLRDGVPTHHILAFSPADGRWHEAGRLRVPLNNPAAGPLGAGVALVGGRSAAGATASVTLLQPAS